MFPSEISNRWFGRNPHVMKLATTHRPSFRPMVSKLWIGSAVENRNVVWTTITNHDARVVVKLALKMEMKMWFFPHRKSRGRQIWSSNMKFVEFCPSPNRSIFAFGGQYVSLAMDFRVWFHLNRFLRKMRTQGDRDNLIWQALIWLYQICRVRGRRTSGGRVLWDSRSESLSQSLKDWKTENRTGFHKWVSS